jgi:hypothetical protein
MLAHQGVRVGHRLGRGPADELHGCFHALDRHAWRQRRGIAMHDVLVGIAFGHGQAQGHVDHMRPGRAHADGAVPRVDEPVPGQRLFVNSLGQRSRRLQSRANAPVRHPARAQQLHEPDARPAQPADDPHVLRGQGGGGVYHHRRFDHLAPRVRDGMGAFRRPVRAFEALAPAAIARPLVRQHVVRRRERKLRHRRRCGNTAGLGEQSRREQHDAGRKHGSPAHPPW